MVGIMVGRRFNPKPSDFPSPSEMEGWLQREVVDVKRAAELRIKDATAFVAAYSKGCISKEEAEERSYEYSRRWGEPIFGILRAEGLTDEQILKQLDEARNKLFPRPPSR